MAGYHLDEIKKRRHGSDKYEVITTNHELCGHVIED